MAKQKPKFVFFDYGGVLDSHGVHTRVLFWEAALAAGLCERNETRRKEFQEAYTWADQEMMRTESAIGMGLACFNHHNMALIFKRLGGGDDAKITRAGEILTNQMQKCLAESAHVLSQIDLPKGIISNFTGNLEEILKEERLLKYFDHVTESFYVKAAKPDLTIFLTALSKVDADASECIYVGDNIKNDIEPARALGIKTILFDPSGKGSPAANFVIREIKDLLSYLPRVER